MLLQVMGKQWGKIAESMVSRNHLQCRSHGQKYINSLIKLVKVIESENLSISDFEKIRKYEKECQLLLEKYKSYSLDFQKYNCRLRPEFFPSYLFDKVIYQ